MVKFKRKKFFALRLTVFLLIIVACGVGFRWNGVITDFANRQIFGNELPPQDLTFDGGLDVHFINVGQGDAAVIRFPNEQIMIVDAGTNTNASRDAFSNYLRTHIFSGTTQSSQRVVDYFVATHSHADHIGAGYYLLANYDVRHVVRPISFTQYEITNNVPATFGLTYPFVVHNTVLFQNFTGRLNQSSTSVSIPYRGKTWNVGGADIKFLSPHGHYFDAINRTSAIFTVTFAGRTIMFTGDSYVACEVDMLAFFGNTMPSVDILDVSHHGSTTSTSQAFIDAISPTYAVIQVGTNNFGHPHNAILRRLEAADATILTTRQVGDILIRVSAVGAMEVAGSVAPGEWFDYWMLVTMVVVFAFGALLAIDFVTKSQKQNRSTNSRTRRR